MGWFKRVSEFVAKTTAKAADVEAEFDAIAAALNEVITIGEARATLDWVVGPEFHTEASVVVDAAVDSLIKIDWTVDASLYNQGATVIGVIRFDGAGQAATQAAIIDFNESRGVTRATISQSAVIDLPKGIHTIELRVESTGGSTTINKTHTGFSYVITPKPE